MGSRSSLWHNTTRQHVFIHLQDKSRGVSRAGIEDVYGDGLAEHDAQIGQLLAKLDELGLSKNTIVIYTTDNGAYQYMWPEGGTTPFRGDKGTTWEGGVRVPFVVRWPGAPDGRVSAEIVAMEDLLPTLAAAAGEPDVVAKLKAGADYGRPEATSCIWTATTSTALFTGKSDKSVRNFIFYYDETVLTAIRYRQFKITFSEKAGNHWDDPLLNLGRPRITNLLTDPFERQTGDLNRQMNEHKAWGLDANPGRSPSASCIVQGVSGPTGRFECQRGQDHRRRAITDSPASITRLNRERSGPWRRYGWDWRSQWWRVLPHYSPLAPPKPQRTGRCCLFRPAVGERRRADLAGIETRPARRAEPPPADAPNI